MFANQLKSSSAGRWLWHCYGTLVLAAIVIAPSWAQAQTGVVNTGATSTLVGQVNVGSVHVDVTIPVSAMTSLRLQVVLPVPGGTISLIDPRGNVVIASNDPGLSFLDGQALAPPLPGGVYITPEVANPADGNWVLRAQFPAAPTRTIALLTVFASSPYQTGIVLMGQTFRVGQPVPMGVLVTNGGVPIKGLAPTLRVSKVGATIATLNAVDSGLPGDYDGLANDGIYSGGVTFIEAGRFLIEGTVRIPVAGGSIARSATGFIDVMPRNYALNFVTGGFATGTGGCVSQLNITANATAQQSGTYSTAATLKSPDGTTFVKRANNVRAVSGAFDTTVSFTSKEVRSHFLHGGVFTIDPLDVVSVANDLVTLEARRAAAYTYPNLPITQFCADPIEIGLSASVSPALRSGSIGQLDFRLPISVTTAGTYNVSFKITDSQGSEVGQFAVSPTLSTGVVNSINASVPAARLQKADGPFNVESVLIVGAGRSAQVSRVVVESSAFSRWQFFPTVTGDLNGDGSVDAADRDLLLSYRNATALVPGDRRDLNGDGKIDLLDARLIVLRACKSPNCPQN